MVRVPLRKKWWVILGVLLVLGAWMTLRNRSRAYKVDTTRAVKKNLEEMVVASGEVQPWTKIKVGSRTSGTVHRVAVEEGQEVRKGDILVMIDPIPLQTQLNRIRAELEAARLQVKSARTLWEQAKREANRAEELAPQGLITREGLEKARTEFSVREQEYHVARKRVAELEAQLQGIQHDLDQVVIRAPMDGWVIGVYVKEGETVVVSIAGIGGEQTLVKIGDLTRWKVKLDVDETDIVRLHVGQPARIRLDALPDRMFNGKVTLVGYEPRRAESAQLGSTTQETRFPVEVELASRLPQVRPGFTVHAEIITARAEHALAIPITALQYRTFPGKTGQHEQPGVFVYESGRVRFQPIETGIMGEYDVEVRSGLQEGQEVITGPFHILKALKDGDRVQIGQHGAS